MRSKTEKETYESAKNILLDDANYYLELANESQIRGDSKSYLDLMAKYEVLMDEVAQFEFLIQSFKKRSKK